MKYIQEKNPAIFHHSGTDNHSKPFVAEQWVSNSNISQVTVLAKGSQTGGKGSWEIVEDTPSN